MNTIVLDTFTDAAGTSAASHTVEIGGPIVPGTGDDAKITTANRLRGQSLGGGTFAYTAKPASKNWEVEFSVYVASASGGISITCSGYTLNYSVSNGYWNLTGGSLPSPLHSGDIAYSPGDRIKGKFASQGGTVTVTTDGTQLFSSADSAQPAVAAPGFVFFEQDTDATGFQLEAFSAFDVGASGVDLDGTFLIDGGTLLNVASDNEFYLIGLTDLLTATYVTTATVTATVKNLSGSTIGTVTLSYVAGSMTVTQPNGQTRTSAGGNYRGQLPAATALVEGTVYNILVTATSGTNQREWRGTYTAGYSTK